MCKYFINLLTKSWKVFSFVHDIILKIRIFRTYLFVSELIGIDPDKEHPLPWYPPICQVPKSFDRKYIPPELVKATTGYNLPDTSLTPMLTALVNDAEISEIGQRILTATNSVGLVSLNI